MNIIVCLDDKNGMLFNKRRQSSDREVCRRILEQTAQSRLWMDPYSAKLFGEAADRICVDETFLDKCADGDWCFVEKADVAACIDRIHKVVLYRWNRRYPADVVFPMEVFSRRWALESRCEFAGNSHETVTEEVYVL